MVDDEDALATLVLALRERPRDVGELRRLSALSPERTDRAINALVRDGLLVRRGEHLDVVDPAKPVREVAAGLAAYAEALPRLMRAWQDGVGARGHVDAEVIHGADERWLAWVRHARLHPPQAPVVLYPRLHALREVILPGMTTALAEAGGPVMRMVFPAISAATEDDRAVLDQLVADGVRVRLARSVPSWLYADPGVMAALPLVWGEGSPASVMIVGDAAVTAVASAYAELLWSTAHDFVLPRPAWADVLRLMALGMSDTAIAAASRASLRTVQRRIAEAMEHYGVGSRFELGMAWRVDPSGGATADEAVGMPAPTRAEADLSGTDR